MLSLVAVILPTILLLFYPLHYKVLSALRISESLCALVAFSPIEKMKPFFDSFQGCFKDEYRFFSGLYFVYRFLMIFIAVFFTIQNCLFVIEVQLVVMLVLHSICQPYKYRLHNVIDTLLFGNLAIINAFTYYNYSTTILSDAPSSISIIIWVQTALIILPMPLMLLYLVLSLKKRCMAKERSKNLRHDDLPARLDYGSCDFS